MSANTPTTITPAELAAELEIDAKRLRGWLRANATRDAAVKGTSWAIDAETADAARARFSTVDDTDALIARAATVLG